MDETPLPVVNRGRLHRVAPEPPSIEWNLNTFCAGFVLVCMFCMYKRAIDVSHKRERLDSLLLR
jgi:hypothetical protein